MINASRNGGLVRALGGWGWGGHGKGKPDSFQAVESALADLSRHFDPCRLINFLSKRFYLKIKWVTDREEIVDLITMIFMTPSEKCITGESNQTLFKPRG